MGRSIALRLGLTALGVLLSAVPASAGSKLPVSQYGKLVSTFPMAVAFEKGWFSQNGLDVDGIISPDGGGTSIRNMLASDLPLGEVGFQAVVNTLAKTKLDLVVVFSSTNTLAELSWITMPNSGIKSPGDLKGKTIGYSNPQSTTESVVRLVLEKAGVAPDQVKLVATGGLSAGITALTQGGLDATPAIDPFLSLNQDKFGMVFRAVDYLPRLTYDVGITTRRFAQQHPEQIRALIEARRRAVKLIYEHPEETIPIYAKVWETDQKTAELMVDRAIQFHYWQEGEFDAEGLESAIRAMQVVGALNTDFDPKRFIDQSFLPADLRRPL